MFIASLTYTCDIDRIEAFLEEHVAFLKKHYAAGHFLVSGRKAPRTGGMIIARSMDRAKFDAILAEDPFNREKLATYDITELLPTMTAEGLETLLESA